MFRKCILTGLFLTVISLCHNCFADDPNVIAEFTGEMTCGYIKVSAEQAHAMAFDITGSPTVTEVQLPLSRDIGCGGGGSLTMELRPDSDNQPSATVLTAQASVAASEIPGSSEGPMWITFRLPPGTTLTQGRNWIVCKSTDARVSWYCPYYGDDPNDDYGNDWMDTKYSTDGGSSWDLEILDFYFKVFGSRVMKDTITSVEADPGTVEVTRSCYILVTVTDEDGSPIWGTVSLSASDGILDSNTLDLNIFGRAWTEWTPPPSLINQTVTATYLPGQGFNGIDYNDSNSTTLIIVKDFTGYRDTETSVSLSENLMKTHDQITVTATVTDLTQPPAVVNSGKVLFRCSDGIFTWPSTASVTNGTAAIQWKAPDVNGVFTIDADYQGDDFGSTKFQASSGSNDVTVAWRDFNTTTILTISPEYPYIARDTYVSVVVKENTTNTRIHDGKVRFSSQSIITPPGWFDATDVNVTSGKDYTKWNCPTSIGDVNITATYQPDQPYIVDGCRYLSSSDTKVVTVVKDTDSTGTALSWFSQWISDYSSADQTSIASTKTSGEGFQDTLTSFGWGSMGTENEKHSNSGARAYYMRHRWFPPPLKAGKENDHLDKHDITWYNGHGLKDLITFTHPWKYPYYDREFKSKQACNISGSPRWGDKDAEWVAMKGCKVLSRTEGWAGTMNGLHLICGFHTNSRGSSRFGPVFASLMTKEDIHDEPHPIVQSWFLTGEMTQPHGRRQVVIGAISEMCSEYLWGQGRVYNDTAVSVAKVWSQDVNNLPDANAGGPYTVLVGEPVPLDATATTRGKADESVLEYRWDMDVNTNTDPCDFDYDDIDEANDDANVFGVYGHIPFRHAFKKSGVYQIRLMVRDDLFQFDDCWTTVTVNDPPPAPSPPPATTASNPEPEMSGEANEPEIIENFEPNTLPTETQLPMFKMAGTNTGFEQMLNVGSYYGMTTETAGLDTVGNWNMVDGSQELIINQHTGSIMYIHKDWTYIVNNPAPVLPSDSQTKSIADSWLAANSIPQTNVVFDRITYICHGDIEPEWETYTKVPFEKRADYHRVFNVMDQNYPAVGPGGKISVLIDESWDVRSFIKVWREVSQEPNVPLMPAATAIQEFHRLGQKALIKESRFPVCEIVNIDNVSLGYYEDDFVTPQQWVTPVYILDLTCIEGETTENVQVYMSAMDELLEIDINSPLPETTVEVNEPVSFSSVVHQGLGPFTYEWTSDVDGLLSTEPNFTTSALSGRYRTEPGVCEILPHSICLKVTDAYGLTAAEFVDVTVNKLCCDAKRDGIVNMEDFAEFSLGWLSKTGDANYDEEIDFDETGTIDVNDMCVLSDEWLQTDSGFQ